MWKNVVYRPGRLRAVAYREGVAIGADTVVTAGPPAKIRLTPDRSTIAADGMDLSYILVEALDRDGHPAPLAHNRIHITVDGPARIAGVGNGNPQSFRPFQADHVDLFYGKAMLILGSGRETGRVRVTAAADGLERARATIRIENAKDAGPTSGPSQGDRRRYP